MKLKETIDLPKVTYSELEDLGLNHLGIISESSSLTVYEQEWNWD